MLKAFRHGLKVMHCRLFHTHVYHDVLFIDPTLFDTHIFWGCIKCGLWQRVTY